eukprot:COSAG04_NODE_8310_length_992_cov_2.206047_2_plen_51_part_01
MHSLQPCTQFKRALTVAGIVLLDLLLRLLVLRKPVVHLLANHLHHATSAKP